MKISHHSSWLTVAIIIFLSVVLCKSFLHSGFPYTHDGENHLARFANYKVAVKEGQLPPRFAPNLMNNYGYPVFEFNYPLANIISLPLAFAKLNYEVIFKLIAGAGVVTCLLGGYLWLSELEFPVPARWFGVAVLAVSPYLIQTLIYRGSIGEVLAMALLPWLGLTVERAKRLHRLNAQFITLSAGLWMLFLLAHNVTVLFGVPVILLYAAWRYWPDWRKLICFMIPFVCGILLTLWFWLPALLEKSLIVVGTADLSQDFSSHFPTVHQLLFAPLTFGYSYIGSVDSASFALGATQWVVLILASILVLKLWRSRQLKLLQLSTQAFFLICLWGLVLAQLQFTLPLWKLIPFSNFIQFPWRLGLLFSVMIVPVAAWVFSVLNKTGQKALLLVLLWQLVVFWQLSPIDYFHKPSLAYEQFTQSTSTANENLPLTFRYENLSDWQPQPSLLSGQGQAFVQSWNGSARSYTLQLQTPAVITEPTINFPGWETTVMPEGQPAKVISYSDSLSIAGRVAYQLPAGNYQVHTQFTQHTWSRELGNTVSLISAGVLVFWFVLSLKKAHNEQHT